MSGRVRGKTALVTGAAQGIGRAVALALAREGARVLLSDLNLEGVEKAASEINSELGRGTTLATRHDVASEADWIAAVALAKESLGGLSVLVNNAGIAQLGSVEDLSLEEWRRGMSVNADSVFLGCKYALPVMREESAGLDHQSLVDRRPYRLTQFRGLQRFEGCGVAPVKVRRAALRSQPLGHSLQFGSSDFYPDPNSRLARCGAG